MMLLCGPPYSWGLSLDFLLYYYIFPILFLFRQKSFCMWETYRYPYFSYLKEDRKILLGTSVKIWTGREQISYLSFQIGAQTKEQKHRKHEN